MSTGHLVVDGEGLYQRNELELASNLGGQEGEPLMNTSLADHLMVEGESLQSYDHTGIIDPNDCPRLGGQEGEPLVLAEDAENIQWGVGRGVAETENIQQLGGQEGEDFDLDPGDQRLQVAAVLRYIHYS